MHGKILFGDMRMVLLRNGNYKEGLSYEQPAYENLSIGNLMEGLQHWEKISWLHPKERKHLELIKP